MEFTQSIAASAGALGEIGHGVAFGKDSIVSTSAKSVGVASNPNLSVDLEITYYPGVDDPSIVAGVSEIRGFEMGPVGWGSVYIDGVEVGATFFTGWGPSKWKFGGFVYRQNTSISADPVRYDAGSRYRIKDEF